MIELGVAGRGCWRVQPATLLLWQQAVVPIGVPAVAPRWQATRNRQDPRACKIRAMIHNEKEYKEAVF